jgi:hypothetical protein
MLLSIREFINNYEKGEFARFSIRSVINAGWAHWDCEPNELLPKLNAYYPYIKLLTHSNKIDTGSQSFYLKNKSSEEGNLDFIVFFDRIKKSKIYVIKIYPAAINSKEIIELWHTEDDPGGPVISGSWEEIRKFFEV